MGITGPGLRRVRLTWATLLLALAGAAAMVLGTASTADATPGTDDYPSYLKNAAQDSKVDPWNFYNRECTSFVAWRLNNDNGVKFTNHYLGPHWGNASIWRAAARDSGVPVDQTPVVGAVAWWQAGSIGSSRGHVAWVEKVTTSSITIEEYNYLRRGYYDTRTIPVTSGSWPTAFIHVSDTALSNVQPPTITGTAQVGQRLVAARGSWTPAGATYSFQWLAGGKPINGATTRRFTPTAAQLSRHVRVQVTARKAGVAPATVTSGRTAPVAAGVLANTAPAAISGTPQVGRTLTAQPGSWSPAPDYAYQWAVDGTAVPGGTGPAYTPAPADVGRSVTVTVTASRAGYRTATSTSAASATVVRGSFANTAAPSIIGTPQVDSTLTAGPGSWAPAGRYRYQWLADGTAIPGATRTTYVPTPDTVGAQIGLRVTASTAGYDDATATAPPTGPVLKGTFTEAVVPTVNGTPQVGVPLSATGGSWTPVPSSVGYQWLADGVPVPGATATTFTPTAAQQGRRMSVRVVVARDGYTTAQDDAAPTGPVALGRLTSTAPPTVTGSAMLGRTLAATSGAWSVAGGTPAYQWLRDGTPIPTATGASYQPVDADVGHRLAVRVTVQPPGYRPATAVSTATTPVLRGVASLSGVPVVRGTPYLGHTLTVAPFRTTPADAAPAYQWLRAGHPVPGATRASYVVHRADLGRHLRVVVSLAPPDWAPGSWTSARTDVATSRPVLRVVPTRDGRSLRLQVSVTAPGVPGVHGLATATAAGRTLGQGVVRRGQLDWTLKQVPAGLRSVRLTFTGSYRVADDWVRVALPR